MSDGKTAEKSDEKKPSEEKPAAEFTDEAKPPEDGTKAPEDESKPSGDETKPSGDEQTAKDEEPGELPPLLDSCDLKGLIKYMKEKKDTLKVIVMTGAGLSTAAGIPDFRSPGTGLYDNLQKYNLPTPQSIFNLDYFMEHPEPFFKLAKGLWPGVVCPTLAHYFIRMLDEEGMLLKLFTQNIDTLERLTGLKDNRIIEAHGSFNKGHCLRCRKEYSHEWLKDKIVGSKNTDAVPIPVCEEDECKKVESERQEKGLSWEDSQKALGNPPIVKPDIVFFGERLPDKFVEGMKDFDSCNLLIIMGTSLVVHPFASLVNYVNARCPRILLNLEAPKHMMFDEAMPTFFQSSCFMFEHASNTRDVFLQGTCDDSCQKIADGLGLEKQLQKMVADEKKKFSLPSVAKSSTPAASVQKKSPTRASPPAASGQKKSPTRSTPAASGQKKSPTRSSPPAASGQKKSPAKSSPGNKSSPDVDGVVKGMKILSVKKK